MIEKLLELLKALGYIPASGFGEVVFIFQNGKIHRVKTTDDRLIK